MGNSKKSKIFYFSNIRISEITFEVDISSFDIILVIAHCQEVKVSFSIVVWFQFRRWSRDVVVKLEFPSKAPTAWVRARLHAGDKSLKELNLVNAIVFLYLTILTLTNLVINIKFIYSWNSRLGIRPTPVISIVILSQKMLPPSHAVAARGSQAAHGSSNLEKVS